MMKKLSILLLCLWMSAVVVGQNITLTFTGKNDDNQWVKLNKVVIENLSREWQEIITYPDTVLGVTPVGIRDLNKENTNLLFQNIPNPFDGETDVTIQLSESDKVVLDVYDIHGKSVLSHKEQLPAGHHTFRLHLNVPQTYLIMVRTKWQKAAVKMINLKSGGANTIHYLGAAGSIAYHLKASKGDSDKIFAKGDSMSYTGYALIANKEVTSDNIRQKQTTSEALSLLFHTKADIVTGNITNITYTSAVCAGELVHTAGFPLLEKGICYAASDAIDATQINKPSDLELGAFEVSLDSLEANTTYYVKAYATTPCGTFYGEQKSFTTIAYGLPLVKTAEVSEIDFFSAVSGGEITADGGEVVTACGLCWGTTEHPDTNSNKAMGVLTDNKFTVTMDNLQIETDYFVRAFATNKVGTSYGNEYKFTTKAAVVPTVITDTVSNISIRSAFCGGKITDDGHADIIEAGICWAVDPNPTIDSTHVAAAEGATEFTLQMTNLTPMTVYYVRAYAKNEKGVAYGAPKVFNTLPAFATVTTSKASKVTHNSAVCGGEVIDDAGVPVTAFGVCYNTKEEPSLYAGFRIECGDGMGAFSDTLRNLTKGTTYYVRAYATNASGTSYGQQISFTTDSIVPPEINMYGVSSITYFEAALSAVVVCDTNRFSILDHGFCVDTLPNPTTKSAKVISQGAGSGSYSATVTGLIPNTLYYVRAYASYNDTTIYSTSQKFTTQECIAPVVTTTPANSIETTKAYSGGTVTSPDNARIIRVGVVYSKTGVPVKDDSSSVTLINMLNGSSWTSFLDPFNLLEPGTTYYVRAWAENGCTIGYGQIDTFSTHAIELPVVYTLEITDIQANQASCSYSVMSNGGGRITKRGLCWDTIPGVNLEKVGVNHTETANTELMKTYKEIMTGLEPNDSIYVRSYVVNEAGVGYGAEVSFKTLGLSSAEVTTFEPAGITPFGAMMGGDVTYDGGNAVTARGICYATHENPTLADKHTENGTGAGWYLSTLKELTPNTTYYARAYAINSDGTAFGDQFTFTTYGISPAFECGKSAVEDIDENQYPTVLIGSQCWMGANLRTTRYADGTAITRAKMTSTTLNSRKYFELDANTPEFGFGYSFAAVLHAADGDKVSTVVSPNASTANPSGVQGPCPNGWHVPSKAEFQELIAYIKANKETMCADGCPAGIAKSVSSKYAWKASANACAPGNEPENNNTTGLNVYPAGCYENTGGNNFIGSTATFATCSYNAKTTGQGYAFLTYANTTSGDISLQPTYTYFKQEAVRCVKDAATTK